VNILNLLPDPNARQAIEDAVIRVAVQQHEKQRAIEGAKTESTTKE
jgi:hypothetical protein